MPVGTVTEVTEVTELSDVELLRLHLEGHDKAIGEILGVAEGTIKSRCARGRAALALHLGLVVEHR